MLPGAAPIIIRETSTATLVIALLGLVFSVVALAWQAATFFLAGPRVKVSLDEALRRPGGAMIGPLAAYTDLDALQNAGYEPCLAVTGVNVGRMPITVDAWSITFGNNASYVGSPDPLNPSLPYRLEAHSSATWYAPLDHLQQLRASFTDQSEAAARAVGTLRLANGRTVASKSSIVVGG